MGNIRNSLISFQAWITKVKNAKTNNIVMSLNNLKRDYNQNMELIYRLESELTRLRDDEISAKTHEIKLFDHLHNEKPSPLFLTLLKCNKEEDLQCIRDDDGNLLKDDTSRIARITNTFSDITVARSQKGLSANS
jgi:hypothetical protein